MLSLESILVSVPKHGGTDTLHITRHELGNKNGMGDFASNPRVLGLRRNYARAMEM